MTEKIETTSVPQIEPPDQQTNSDCFRCALAGLLGQPYEAVPDFYGDEIRAHGSPNTAWHRLQAWLQAQGLVAVEFPENVPLNLVPEGTRAILTGRSPRVPDWDHSVLGEWREGSWRIVHDPHPSRAGFKGGVKVLTFVALLNPAALLQRAWMAQPKGDANA